MIDQNVPKPDSPSVSIPRQLSNLCNIGVFMEIKRCQEYWKVDWTLEAIRTTNNRLDLYLTNDVATEDIKADLLSAVTRGNMLLTEYIDDQAWTSN